MSDSDSPVAIDHGILLTEITGDKPLLATLGGDELVIIKDGDVFYAVGAQCTHMGAPLQQGLVAHGEIRCPWHHAKFCIKTGAAVGAPAFEPLQRFQTLIEGERLFVRKAAAQTPTRTSSTSPRRVVIIGAGAAGFACADMLLKQGFDGALTLVNTDRDMPYDRTVCSKEYLAGKTTRSECFMPGDDLFAESAGSEARAILLQETATDIDIEAKEVVLDSGERLGFDILVLANGAEPERPSLPGLDSDRVHVLRTLHDADHIIEQAKQASSVAILGVSFIGLEAAASLSERKLKVHVIAPDEVPLSHSVGAAVGAMIRKVHEAKGVVFHLGRQLKSYEGTSVSLDDGSSFDADFIVLGTGVKPRTELATQAGLHVASEEEGGGVIVNDRLESSVRGIFAVGDIARYPDPTTGRLIRVEHWVHAQRQGQFVARAIMGAEVRFADVPFFWSAHFDTTLHYIGHVDQPKQHDLEGSIEEQEFALTFADGKGGEALLTCEQDLKSLRTEAAWESGHGTVKHR